MRLQTPPLGTDPGTGLLDRVGFARKFGDAMAASQQGASVALVSMDSFPASAESRGSLVRHWIIRATAEELRQSFRTTDILGRWAEDQFIVLCLGADCAGGMRALEKALLRLQGAPVRVRDEREVRVSFCGGVAEVRPGDLLWDSIEEAQRYLGLAKAEGHGRIRSKLGLATPILSRVLLFEDDSINSALIRHRLEKIGCQVRHVADATHAPSVANVTGPSLILLDLNMRGIDGFEMLSALRDTPRLRYTPIVVLSHVQSEKDLVRSFELGADDFILKPFSTDELVARVQRLLRGRAMSRGSI